MPGAADLIGRATTADALAQRRGCSHVVTEAVLGYHDPVHGVARLRPRRSRDSARKESRGSNRDRDRLRRRVCRVCWRTGVGASCTLSASSSLTGHSRVEQARWYTGRARSDGLRVTAWLSFRDRPLRAQLTWLDPEWGARLASRHSGEGRRLGKSIPASMPLSVSTFSSDSKRVTQLTAVVHIPADTSPKESPIEGVVRATVRYPFRVSRGFTEANKSNRFVDQHLGWSAVPTR